MTMVAGIRLTKRTAGLSLQVGAENSISSAGQKLGTFLQTTGPWSLPVSDLLPGAEPEPPRRQGDRGLAPILSLLPPEIQSFQR